MTRITAKSIKFAQKPIQFLLKVRNFKYFSLRAVNHALNRKKFLIIVILAISIFLGFVKFNSQKNSQVKEKPLEIRTFALGRVQPTGYVRSITYPMIYQSSRIKKLYVDENDFVRKGSPLFIVEDSNDALFNMESSREKLQQQLSELKSSEAKMLASRSLRDFYKDQSKRYMFLARTGAASTEQAEEKLTLYKSTEQDYISNLELVKANKSALNSIGWQHRSNKFKSVISTIRAPADVKIFKIYSRAGESIQVGKPVMDVGESQLMGVLAQVHRMDIKDIRLNQTVLVTVNGLPSIKWKGKVMKISSQISQQSINSDDPAATVANRVFDVLIKLNPDSSLEAQYYNYMEVNVMFDR